MNYDLITIFFDASCLVAAAYSSSGASRRLLDDCGQEFLNGFASQLVLNEARDSLWRKSAWGALAEYERLVRESHLTVIFLADPPAGAHPGINAKDAHVYAASLAASAPYLITLDRRLILEVNALDGPLTALTPGDFIARVLRGESDPFMSH